MTADDLHQMVREMCDKDSQKAVAARIGVSAAYLNDYLHFRREPGPKILEALGMRQVVRYEKSIRCHGPDDHKCRVCGLGCSLSL